MKPDVIRSLLLHDVHNPLYNAFMYGWIRVFGDSEVSIRVPTLLAGSGMIVIVWRWLRERFGPMQAWWAATFLTVNPVHIWYSCEAKNNMFTVLFVTMTLWRLDVLARTLSARDVAFAAIAGALAMWTDFQSLLVLPAVWIAWCVVQARDTQRQRSWMVPLTAAAGSLVLVSPLMLFKAQRLEELERHYLTYFHWYEPLRMLLVYFPTGNALVPTVRATWPLAALGFAPFVVLGLARGVGVLRGSSWGCVVLLVLLVPMLIMWAASEALVQVGSSVRIFQDRNVLVMLPAVAMTLAVGAFAVRTRVGIGLARWGVLVLALASSVVLVTVHRDERTVMYPNSHWRQAAEWLKAAERDASLPIVSRTPLLALEHYLPGRAVKHLPTRTPVQESLPAFLAGQTREFYFVQHEYWANLDAETLAWLDAQYETLHTYNVLHLSVRHMRVRTPALP